MACFYEANNRGKIFIEYEPIETAWAQISGKNCDTTDDCKFLEVGKNKVSIIEGDYSNIKITTSGDISIVK